MDPLTHTATGLFLSRAGLKRWTPLATPILLVAANAPDADIVTAAGGPLAYLHYHRHLTHSLIAMPVMALLAVAVVRLLGRKQIRWPGAFAAALIAVGSHLLLDLTNAYGVRLLLPFSGKWFEGDLTSVVDLWIWAVILLAVAGPLIGRLVGAEISSGTIRHARPRPGIRHFRAGFPAPLQRRTGGATRTRRGNRQRPALPRAAGRAPGRSAQTQPTRGAGGRWRKRRIFTPSPMST